MTITLLYCAKRRRHCNPFPTLVLDRYGISFSSHLKHRIKIGDAKVMQLDNDVYVKCGTKRMILKNVDRVYVINDYLYFNALGQCRIIFNTRRIYKYFNIQILSSRFNIESIKQEAIKDILEHMFNIKNSKKLRRFLYICQNILMINLKDNRIVVGRNKFNLKFTLAYKLRDKVKRVNVY